MPTAFWDQFPKVFALAIQTRLGVFALCACLLALLAWGFFRRGRPGPKIFAFLLLFIGLGALGYATFRSAGEVEAGTKAVQAGKGEVVQGGKIGAALVLGEPVKALSGGSGDRKTCGYGRDTVKLSCVQPQHPNGSLVPESITAHSVNKSGSITEWKVSRDKSYLACVEFRAATRACETLVWIEGRAAAQEEYPIPDASPSK